MLVLLATTNSLGYKVEGIHWLPFHLSTWSVVAPCWAIVSGFDVVPLPEILEVTSTEATPLPACSTIFFAEVYFKTPSSSKTKTESLIALFEGLVLIFLVRLQTKLDFC